ncbi:hypothetical protein Tco_1236201 [Tanacetum coccineum]
MAERILNMEKAQAESSLVKPNTNDDMNIELSKEFLMELQSNAYYETFDKDTVDHIAKVLEMLDLIKIPNVETHRLCMKVFPLSLADDARQWWIDEGDGKITTWKELVEKFFCAWNMSWKKTEEYMKKWSLNEEVNSNPELLDTYSLFGHNSVIKTLFDAILVATRREFNYLQP